MKTKYKILSGIIALAGLFTSCIDENVNVNPETFEEKDLRPEWLLNTSIGNAQMNPHIAERIFVIDWMSAGHFQRASGFALGADANSYSEDYLSVDFAAGWIRDASKAITIAESRLEEGTTFTYFKNIMQMSRIWRAYLLAEVADNFGSIPTVGIGLDEQPVFKSEEDVYKFILEELKDATAKLDPSIPWTDMVVAQDLFYKFDLKKWIKYGNSLRMRMAMRVSYIDPVLAKTHFEDAAKGPYIDAIGDIAQVQERDGWSPFSGVMSRPWNGLNMSKTFYNLAVNLGGLEFVVAGDLQGKLKDPNTHLGMRLDKHLPLTTNDPTAGYLYDGIPKYADPRAQKMYSITGVQDSQGVYPISAFGQDGIYNQNDEKSRERFNIPLYTENVYKRGTNVLDTLLIVNVAYTWNTYVAGVWSNGETANNKANMSVQLTNSANKLSALANKYRTSDGQRIFFGPWESYFLLAEAAVKGWTVAESDQAYYEKGVRASFEHYELSALVEDYLKSEAYNRVGTSVKYTHTTEAASFTIGYLDGYTKEQKSTQYTYPKNSIYNGGATNNDKLTKIITQKFIAQMPWLPLEAWSDHRRLGLPFIENQAVESDYSTQTQVPLTVATSKDCEWRFYPKRLRYPSSWRTQSPKQYQQAVGYLNGPDLSSTVLWWSHKDAN